MTKTFSNADTRFNHANVIKYCARPFASIGAQEVAAGGGLGEIQARPGTDSALKGLPVPKAAIRRVASQ